MTKRFFELKEIQAAVSRVLPDTLKELHHYTDGHALKSIVEQCELWASDVRYLNDTQELHYAIKLNKKILSDRLTNPGVDPDLKDALTHAMQYMHVPLERRVLSISFTTNQDDLTLWNRYCGAPEKTGYCLTFDAHKLQDLANLQGYDIVKCIYNKKRQVEIINHMIDALEEHILLSKRDSDLMIMATGGAGPAGAFIQSLNYLTHVFKDPCFKDEKEWRIIKLTIPQVDIDYRHTAHHFVPYMKFSLTEGDREKLIQMYTETKNGETYPVNVRNACLIPITFITVSPNLKQKETIAATKDFVDSKFLVFTKVKKTKTTIR